MVAVEYIFRVLKRADVRVFERDERYLKKNNKNVSNVSQTCLKWVTRGNSAHFLESQGAIYVRALNNVFKTKIKA